MPVGVGREREQGKEKIIIIKLVTENTVERWDFSGDPVVKTSPFRFRGHKFGASLGN